MLNAIKAARLFAWALVPAFVGACAVPQNYPAQSRPQEPPQPAPAVSANVEQINKAIAAASHQSSSSSRDYRLGADDLVQITIYNIPESEARVTPRTMTLRVSQDGLMVLPLIGSVDVRGKTPGELERELSKAYAKFVRNPQIGVLVTEFRQRVTVMGAVQKPGVIELTGPKTLVDALALAGGVSERAGNQVHIYRQDANGGRQSIVIDLMMLANTGGIGAGPNGSASVNMPLQPGDVVNVPQSGMFFVDGAVGKRGSYPLGRNYTLTQALATAGGVDPELADYSAITINRRVSPEKLEVIPIDLEAVTSGRAVDPQIQPDDVVLVPMSGFKYFVKRFVGTIFSGVSAGAFMGH
jgi:polysaccharide export outer membrane protein